MKYATLLTEAYRRHRDQLEADDRGPLSVTEFRNRQNIRAWRERLARAALPVRAAPGRAHA